MMRPAGNIAIVGGERACWRTAGTIAARHRGRRAPGFTVMLAADARIAARALHENAVQTERLPGRLPGHRQLIRKSHEHGLQPV